MQQGSINVSLKPEGIFRGMTTLARQGPTGFELLENCYVSSDGREIRLFPGFRTVVDPVTLVREPDVMATHLDSYTATTTDARRPVVTTVGSYEFEDDPIDFNEIRYVWARPTNLHCCEQVRGRWIIVGETDFRREPVLNLARNAFVHVTAYTHVAGPPARVDLTIDEAFDTTSGVFHSLDLSQPRRIYLEGLTGPGASILNNKSWEFESFPNATTVRIIANLGSSANNGTGQLGFISLVSYTQRPGAEQDDIDSLTIWTCPQLGDTDEDPITKVYPAHVANRIPDFGDATGNQLEGSSVNDFISRRRQKTLPFRLAPAVAGNRILLAAPGYNCVFQAPVVIPIDYEAGDTSLGLHWVANDIYDRPRMVGIPRAQMWVDTDLTLSGENVYAAASAAMAFGGTDANNANKAGVYKFIVAYQDEGTGEIGLASDPIEITTTLLGTAHQGIRLFVLFPGYLMSECAALTIQLYRTAKTGESYFFDRTIRVTGEGSSGALAVSAKYGLIPESAGVAFYHYVIVDVPYTDDATLEERDQYVPALIEQFPMGAKAVRTLRGWTIYGGALGDTGSRKEMFAGTMSIQNNALSGYPFDQVYARGPSGTFDPLDTPFGGTAIGIPNSYAGQTLVSRVLFPYPRQQVILGNTTNVTEPNLSGVRKVESRWEVLEPALREETALSARTDQECYLLLPRGKIQVSEQDNPGVTPSTSIGIISNELDDDVEAIGDYGGNAVICTRSKTYVLGWATSPVESAPDIASDRFGCIAPNSMVSFDGGCAWLSDRGPVAVSGGAVVHIGQELERFFIGESSRYLRDSEGMMRHAWGCHDAERGLIYFGLYRGADSNTTQVTVNGESFTWVDAPDGHKSRFPCDEVLIYSYRVGAWSRWVPPLQILWMTRGQDADGNSRVFFLGFDGRIYTLDDNYGQWNAEPPKLVTTQASSGTTIYVTGLGQEVSDRGGNTFVEVGMNVLVFRGTGELVGVSTISAFDTGAGTITVADSMETLAGDFVTIGARRARIVSNAVNAKGIETSEVGRVGMRYTLWSRHSTEFGGIPQFSAAKAKAIANNRHDRVDGGAVRQEQEMSAGFAALGSTETQPVLMETGWSEARSSGNNHQIDLTVVSGAQVRIEDLYLETR